MKIKTKTIQLTLPYIHLSKKQKRQLHNLILKILAYISIIIILTFGMMINNLTDTGFSLASVITVPAMVYLIILAYANGYIS